jgi:peptidoglycan/LPS O-acetylase OafA/YrhL
MTYLGRISYGTYLWHWLVILVALRAFHLSTTSTVAIACLVATALASLSYEVLEHPVRSSQRLDRHRRVVIAMGLAISVIGALVVIPTIAKPANATTPTARSPDGGIHARSRRPRLAGRRERRQAVRHLPEPSSLHVHTRARHRPASPAHR